MNQADFAATTIMWSDVMRIVMAMKIDPNSLVELLRHVEKLLKHYDNESLEGVSKELEYISTMRTFVQKQQEK